MKKLSIALVVALLCGAVAMASTAGARGKASTTVTIKYNGDGFQGKVKSSKSKCVKNRTVKVYKQKGSSQDPSTDKKMFKDTTEDNGSWDTGNSGQAKGKFYALAKGPTAVRRASARPSRSSPRRCGGASPAIKPGFRRPPRRRRRSPHLPWPGSFGWASSRGWTPAGPPRCRRPSRPVRPHRSPAGSCR